MIIKGYAFSILYAAACLILSFLIYKLGAPKPITRKIVHILVGFEWVILYHFMGAGVHFLSVCLAFTLVLLISYRKRLLPMIASSDDNAPGTVYYGIAMSLMAIISLIEPRMTVPFGIGVFCTSLGDGLAGLVGYSVRARFNVKIYGNKTIVGALVNFLASFCTAIVFSEVFALGLTLAHATIIALFSLELELFTGRGLDNITITLGTSLVAYSLLYFDNSLHYILPILLTPLIIAFVSSKKALTKGGVIGAVILDILVSAALGNAGFILLVTFFGGSILIDRVKKAKKGGQSSSESVERKGDCRDVVQVMANGAIPGVCALLYFLTENHVFVVAYVAALAEAFADTSASGIGALSGRAFDLFRMKPCKAGISGGMSLAGTLSSLLAAAVISALALAFGMINYIELLVTMLAGFLGGVFDSLLGSILQVKYKCTVCSEIVERREHCGHPTVRHAGISFVDNDVVNFLGTLFAAVATFLIFL